MTMHTMPSATTRSLVTGTMVAIVLFTFASALAGHDACEVPGSDVVPTSAAVTFTVPDRAFNAFDCPAASDSTEAAAVIDRFHVALAAGDSAAAAMLLLPDVVILESGGIESREEYLGGHLRGDMAFAQAVPRERGPIAVRIDGDIAFATSTSVARGEYRGQPVNSAGAELIVLRRTSDGWRIAAVHWSSRQMRS